MPLPAPPPRLAFPALLVANLFLALGPWLVRLADVGPTAAAFWRLSLAVPFLAFFALRGRRGRPSPGWVMIGAVAVGGLFFAADLASWHESILRTRLANATLFGNFASFLFAIYGFLLIRQLPGRIQSLALLLAAIGAALLLGGSLRLSPERFTGDLLAILAAFFYTLYLVAVDRARRTMAHWPVLAVASAAGAVPLLLLALALGETVMPTDWTPIILLSISGQLIGQGLLVYAMGHLSPVVVGLCFLTQPVATAAIGWMVYDERLSAGDGLGALLICAALVLIRLPSRRVATEAAPAH
ncbi:DMT family transporter [Sphingosinicella sp. CPCC 101087]|uniref:DMT family transporter n=1 Tax=Sphingosinicella sp. CPCC 101087 TaxID=2497754 RepID=UPI00101C3D86|nr:DMT family transporter [Sphingosinicella sp. CPCC 101087]